MSKVWFITGASKGLGLTLVTLLLEMGHKVAATSRNKQQLLDAVGAQSEQFLPLAVDLTNETAIEQSLADAHKHFGKLDVIVNNAGYGVGGAIEELSTQEIYDSLNINLLATVHVTRFALPYLRSQRSGHIINISSIAGFSSTTGWSMYSASKYAVIGLTEGLAQDVKELGIWATVVAPGAFRTEFLTAGSLVIAGKRIADYTGVHANQERYQQMDRHQIGDPLKAAQVMVAITELPEPPVVLFLGSDAYTRAAKKIEDQKISLEKYKDTSFSTDY